MVITGVALLALSAGFSAWVARWLRREGRSTAPAWKMFARSATTWSGLILLTTAINAIAGGVLILAAVGFGLLQIVRGVREFPRVWRRIGDPVAWRSDSGPSA